MSNISQFKKWKSNIRPGVNIHWMCRCMKRFPENIENSYQPILNNQYINNPLKTHTWTEETLYKLKID